MSLTPLAFTGVSKFSTDFQAIVNRSVAIANLPVQALQNDQKGLAEKDTALTGLRNSVGGFAASLEGLGALGNGGAATVSSSSAVVSASLAPGATPGTYRISDITSLAETASATSAAGWASAGGAAVATGPDRKVELLINGVSREFTLSEASDNLYGLRDAINSSSAGVSASVLDTGAGAGAERYFLVLSAQQAGPQSIQLRTESGNSASASMEMTNPGASASFTVNGRRVTTNDNFVSGVIAGVHFRLNETTAEGQVVQLTVAPNSSPIVSALSSFVNAYNDLAANLDAHIGQSAGVLSGDSLISSLYGRLRAATSLLGSGPIQSLADLGITLDKKGVMSFDSSSVATAGAARIQDILAYLGSPTSGMAALTSQFTEFSDPISGLIRARRTSLEKTDARLNAQIAEMTARISTMQNTLLARLQAADGLLARLENQQGMLSASITSLNTLTNGKSQG